MVKLFVLIFHRKSFCPSRCYHLHLRTLNTSRKTTRINGTGGAKVWKCWTYGNWWWYVTKQNDYCHFLSGYCMHLIFVSSGHLEHVPHCSIIAVLSGINEANRERYFLTGRADPLEKQSGKSKQWISSDLLLSCCLLTAVLVFFNSKAMCWGGCILRNDMLEVSFSESFSSKQTYYLETLSYSLLLF